MTNKIEEILEGFDAKFYYEHEERGLTYLRNDVVGWLRQTLQSYGEACREEERERIANEIEDTWSSLYGAYLNNQDLKGLLKDIALTKNV